MAAPRATWKGYLKLSLVTCPIALYSAVSDAEKTKFSQLNSATGNKIKQQLVDSETGDPVERADVVKGYEHEKGQFLRVEEADFEGIKLDSTHTIELVSFVPKEEVDDRFQDGHYFVGPSDKIGVDAFAVIRDAMNAKGVVGIGRVVMSKRERIVMLVPSEKGIMAATLRYDYEVRKKASVFDDIPDVKVPPEMLELAGAMVDKMKGSFDATKFEDRYETGLQELIKAKLAGAPTPEAKKPEQKSAIDLMAALRASVEGKAAAPAQAAAPKEPKDNVVPIAAAKDPEPKAKDAKAPKAKGSEVKGSEVKAAAPDRRRKKGATETVPTAEGDLAEEEAPAPAVNVGF